MIDTRDQMNNLIMECVSMSFREFQADLERRIAIHLKRRSYPQSMVVNMAQSISRDVHDYLEAECFRTGAARKAVEKLL